MLGSTYNANLQIVQSGADVVIYNEMMHGGRIVPLNGIPHLPASIRQLGGDSRGHWEGDTLVVDSTNFTDQTNFRGPPATARQDIFSSAQLHVVERFTRTGPGEILYRFTVEDPGTWDRPWTGEIVMRKIEGPIYEYACHEGNYGLANILAGARAAEAAAKKARSERFHAKTYRGIPGSRRFLVVLLRDQGIRSPARDRNHARRVHVRRQRGLEFAFGNHGRRR